MCITKDEELTVKMKAIESSIKSIYCWKILELVVEHHYLQTGGLEEREVVNRRIKSPFVNYTWRPGLNIRSDEDIPSHMSKSESDKGIHVFIDLGEALDYQKRRLPKGYRHTFVVPVRCDLKDIIAFGDFEFQAGDENSEIDIHYKTATFTQVTLHPKDYYTCLPEENPDKEN